MNSHDRPQAAAAWQVLVAMRLLSPCEAAFAARVLREPGLAPCLELAETVHLHVKVGRTEALPQSRLEAAGAILDHAREGFVKYRLPGAVNAIFSHIPVAAEDLGAAATPQRARPFLDHVGIDVRTIDTSSRAAFDALPGAALVRGWAHVAQGGQGRPVRCCHVEVGEKHWLYLPGAAARPVEVALGPLRRNDSGYGCDLRPADPRVASRHAAACCPGALIPAP